MIIVVVVIFDYVEKIDNFTETKAPLKAIIFDYYLNFIPFFINQFSGLFTFIAVIFFTSKMAYQTEIVAMLSGGMSFRRLMWPYFLGALIIASISLALNLWVIPVSQRSCVAFENQYIPRKARFQYDKNIYRQIEPGTFAYIRNYSKESSQASFFSLEEYESGGDDRIARSRRGEVQPPIPSGGRPDDIPPARSIRSAWKPSRSTAIWIRSSIWMSMNWAASTS